MLAALVWQPAAKSSAARRQESPTVWGRITFNVVPPLEISYWKYPDALRFGKNEGHSIATVKNEHGDAEPPRKTPRVDPNGFSPRVSRRLGVHSS